MTGSKNIAMKGTLLRKFSAYGIRSKLGIRISLCHSSSFYSINAGVLQDSVLASNLFLLNINNPFYSTSNTNHCFADDSSLHLTNDLENIMKWETRNLVQLNH